MEQPRLAAHHLVLVEAPRPSHGVAAGPSAATRGRPGRRGAGGCGGLSLLLLLEVELPWAEGEEGPVEAGAGGHGRRGTDHLREKRGKLTFA